MGFNFERYFRNDETGHLGFPSEGLEVQQQYFIIIWPAKLAFCEYKSEQRLHFRGMSWCAKM